MESSVYTVQDLQRKYRLSRSQAYAYAHGLPDRLVLRFGRCIRIDKEGLERYLEAEKKA